MTIESGRVDEAEITVEMPVGMLDRVDAFRVKRGYGTRSQVVTEAIQQAAEQHG